MTLDYPILSDLSQYTGIDRIYEYVLLHLLAGKTLDVVDFEKEEWEQLQIMLQSMAI